MNRLAKNLVLFVVLFHLLVFVVEAFLWMSPTVHEPFLERLGTFRVDVHTQAAILKSLFVNQGFYNLFLALAGVAGLFFLRRGNTPVAYALISYMCLSAVFAGLVLALSSTAYAGAVLQAVPPAIALLTMYRVQASPSGSTARS